MNKIHVETKPTKHLSTDTLEKTKEAFYYAATKGRYNLETFKSFTNLFGDDEERSEFIGTLYTSCKRDLDKAAIEAICKIKDWEFDKEYGQTNENG